MHKRPARSPFRVPIAALAAAALGLAALTALPVPGALASTPSGWAPQDLQNAYGLPGVTGAGETVALVTAYDDPDAESDLAVYRSQYNLPACTTANGCFSKVNQTGGTTYPTTTSWTDVDAESLDAISAMCPGCRIVMVEANSSALTDLGQAEDEAVTQATFVDNDFAVSEGEVGQAETTTYDAYFHHSGVAITAPAGDSGYGVSYPADSQYVTAVGGTVLTDTNGAYSETAWPSSGSGCSQFESKPTWQADTGCSGRTLNDVSAVATSLAYYNSATGGGWSTGSGTEISSAVVAGYYGVLVASGASLGTNPVQYFYTNASKFTDITSGSNGTCSVTYLCMAGTGYDGPTGTGSIAPASHTPSTGATPAVYDNLSSNFEVYATSSSGTVEQDAYVSGTGWHGWKNLGAPSGITLTGTPAALYDTATGNFEVYATGSDGSLEQIAYVTGTGWTAWKNITGTTGPAFASSPAAYYDPVTSHIEVYGTGTNNHLEQAAYASGWQWRDLGGSITGTPAAVDDTDTGNTEIYATGTDGTLDQDAWTGTAWTGTRSLGGAISGSPSAFVDSFTGNMEVYATGSGTTGTSVEQAAWKSGTGWTWHNLGGTVTGSPSALLDTATGHPEVYVTSTAGTLQETAYSTSWSSWSTIGSGTTITGSPDAVYDRVTSSLDVYAITSGAVSVISWKSSWGSWKNLGSTFTAP
jgi:hypothetical protein